MNTRKSHRRLVSAAAAAASSIYGPHWLAQAFDNTAIVNTAVQIESGGAFAGTQPRISAEALGAGGKTFAGYAVMDFSANSFASGNLVSAINTFKLTLYDNGLNVTPYGASKPDTFAAAGPVDFYLSTNTGSTASWRPDTNSTSYTINSSMTAGIDLIGNGGNPNTGSAPTLSQLFSLGTLNYTPQPLSATSVGSFSLDFTSTLGQTLASNTNVTEAQFLAQTISNGGLVRLIAAPKYSGSGTVGTGTAADFVGTLQPFGLQATGPALELGGTLAPSPTNASVLSLVDPAGGSNVKSLTLPNINRMWRYGNATSAVTLSVDGITGTNTARYSTVGDTNTFNFAGSVPAPSGTSRGVFTFVAGGHSVGPGTTNYTVTGGIQNLDNPNDTTNISIQQTANVLVDTRTVGLQANANTFVTGGGFLTANLNGTSHGVLTGATITSSINLATSNPANINPGSNTLTLVLLPGTSTISFSSATTGTATVSAGNSVIFGSGTDQDGSAVQSGTEVSTRTFTLKAGTRGGSYVETNNNLGFFSAGPSLTNADDPLAVNPANRGNFNSDAIDYAATVWQTASVTGSASNTSALVSLLTLSNAAASSNIVGGEQIGLRAAARVVNVSSATAQAGFSLSSNIGVGALLTPGTAASGTVGATLAAGVATDTATFDPTNKLNGTYTGKIAYGLEHADQQIIGTAPNDLGSKTINFSAAVAGNSGTGYSANILPGGSYGSVATPYYINRGSGKNSTISFLGGTASGNTNIAVNFGTSASPRAAGDNAAISGTGGDLYVAQSSYDPTIVGNAPALGWFNGGRYINATFGDSDSGAATNEVKGGFNGALTLGNYGIDTTNHVVWAVVDHPGTFVAYNRAAGDTQFRGKVDQNDTTQIVSRGFYRDHLTTHSWSDGDFNGDGAVDQNDITAIVSAGFYRAGFYDAAGPAVATPTLTGNSASPAAVVGSVGDGRPLHFVYTPSTGDLKLQFDNLTGNLQVLDLISTSQQFKNQNASSIFANVGNNFNGPDELYSVQFTGSFADGLDLGNILGTNLDPSTLAADLTLKYAIQGQAPAFGDLIVANTPEPTTLSLVGLGAIGLMSRRRRR